MNLRSLLWEYHASSYRNPSYFHLASFYGPSDIVSNAPIPELTVPLRNPACHRLTLRLRYQTLSSVPLEFFLYVGVHPPAITQPARFSLGKIQSGTLSVIVHGP